MKSTIKIHTFKRKYPSLLNVKVYMFYVHMVARIQIYPAHDHEDMQEYTRWKITILKKIHQVFQLDKLFNRPLELVYSR